MCIRDRNSIAFINSVTGQFGGALSPFQMTRTYGQPWNKGRSVGARKALSQQDVRQIQSSLIDQNNRHDLCLFLVAIDTMLRASDLLRLRVCDVVDGNRNVKTTFPWRQKKTASSVYPVLTPTTQKALLDWVVASDKQSQDYLFTREKPNTGEPISLSLIHISEPTRPY